MCAPYLFISKLTITVITSNIHNRLLRLDIILTSQQSANNCSNISLVTISIQVPTLKILQNWTRNCLFCWLIDKSNNLKKSSHESWKNNKVFDYLSFWKRENSQKKIGYLRFRKGENTLHAASPLAIHIIIVLNLHSN